MGKFLWLMVTLDEYELPLVVTDSAKELAKIAGTSERNVISSACKYRKSGRKTKYRRVRTEEE